MGWRIPFAVGAVLAIVVFYIRRGLAETESFKNAAAQGAPRSGFWPLIRHHPRETGIVMMLTAGGTLAFYAYSIYMQKFLVDTSGFTRETASTINGITLFGFMLLQPVDGALSDRIGRKPLMVGFGVLGVLATGPIFAALETPRSAWTAGALGVALPYALASTIFGGTAEYVALWFKQAGWERGFYWYVTAMIAASPIVYLRMRDTSRIAED